MQLCEIELYLQSWH